MFRLTQELASSQTQLEVKNKELSTALSTFTEQQKKSESNAQELAMAGQGSGERLKEMEKEKSDLMHTLSDLKAKVQISESELGGLKEANAELKKSFEEVKGDHDTLKGNQDTVTHRYENEKALKERAQQMEENERRERIAACAQLLAIQQHHEVEGKETCVSVIIPRHVKAHRVTALPH